MWLLIEGVGEFGKTNILRAKEVTYFFFDQYLFFSTTKYGIVTIYNSNQTTYTA